jgi:hypothetical protein
MRFSACVFVFEEISFNKKTCVSVIMHHALVDAFETEQNRSAIKKYVISMAQHSRDEWNLFYGFMVEMHLKILFRVLGQPLCEHHS